MPTYSQEVNFQGRGEQEGGIVNGKDLEGNLFFKILFIFSLSSKATPKEKWTTLNPDAKQIVNVLYTP